MFDRKLLKNFDYTLLIIVLILIATGLLMITSATSSVANEAERFAAVERQLAAFFIGILLIGLIISFDYNFMGSFYWYFFGANILILLLVKFFGSEINGAKSWIKIGSSTFQPSEISKILIILFLAKILSMLREEHPDEINRLKNLGMVLGLVGVPLLLILIQPDFGTAMVVMVIIAAMLFAGGLSMKYFTAAGLMAAISAPLLWFFKLEEYQKDRIRVFLNPNLDPQNSGFQVIQSKIAIGSGNLLGKGLMQGTQTQMGFLPFKETDFIFSVIGEELGFVACIIIVLLFGALLLKLIDIARNSKDFFGSMIVVGVSAMIGIHVLQNIGMTLGLMPVTGIPLPFISYGGSSLLANMIGIGLVLNVAMRRQKITF